MAARVSEVTLFVQGTSPKAEVARHASARQFSSQRHCVGSLWRTAIDPPSPESTPAKRTSAEDATEQARRVWAPPNCSPLRLGS